MYQLLKYKKVQIYSMKFKRLGLNINYEDILRDKIINSDKTDNIPSINIKEIDLDNINTERKLRLNVIWKSLILIIFLNILKKSMWWGKLHTKMMTNNYIVEFLFLIGFVTWRFIK